MSSPFFSLLERGEPPARAAVRRRVADTAERAFALVRDMPYRRASSRKPEAIVEEWQGHLLGQALPAGRHLPGDGAGPRG